MVMGALRPWAIDTADDEGVSVKLGVGLALTVTEMDVDAKREPETPVIDTRVVPTVAVLLAVSVRTLVPEVGLVPKAAVTPLGRPDAVRAALPVKQNSVTVMVSVAVPP